MIAFLGEIIFKKGVYEKNLENTKKSEIFGAKKSLHQKDFKGIDIMPRQRTDDVQVVWK